MSRKWNLVALGLFALSLFPFGVWAQESSRLDYGQGPVVDMDLDGLTDVGEKELYLTDPVKADTDEDGIFDGVEVLQGSNPLDASSRLGLVETQATLETAGEESPLPWYVSRAAGLVSFALLYVSMLLGLSIRLPFLGKIFAPAYSFKVHCWISLQALLFALLHGGILMFDDFLGFSAKDVFVPFLSSFEPVLVGLGTTAFYLMLVLVLTSYFKKFIPHKAWRAVHWLNVLLYVFGVAHALSLGTDLKEEIYRAIFSGLNAVLVLLILANIANRVFLAVRQKNVERQG